MGFEELFENKDRYHDNNRGMRYPIGNVYLHKSHRASYEQNENLDWFNILEKISSNKRKVLQTNSNNLDVLKVKSH